MGQKLGQNFLINPEKVRKIADFLETRPNETIIEIGPGRGALTQPILEILKTQKGTLLIAIEKDPLLAAALAKTIDDNNQFEMIIGEIREILPNLTKNHQFKNNNYKIIGNIPYYLTGYLLRQLGELEIKPKTIILTIQKEVAERLIAQAPRFNLLAASVQYWADAEIIDRLGRKEFRPMPKVDSAVIRLKPRQEEKTKKEEEGYYRSAKIIFRQPRKTLINNLKSASENPAEILKIVGLETTGRPQDLSVEKLKKIAKILYN